MTTTSDLPEWRLFSSNYTTQLGILPAKNSHLNIELNEPGSGALPIPLDTAIASQIAIGQLAVLYYRGASRFQFFIDNLQYVDANQGEGAGRELSISGRGGLALLDGSVIWSLNSTDTTRTFTAVTKASILKTLIDEAQVRGELTQLTYDFTASVDSAAIAWTDSENYDLPVGTPLLDIAKQFAATGGFEYTLTFSAGIFNLSIYSAGRGSSKPNVRFRIGDNIEDMARDERGNEIFNYYLVKWQGGYVVVSDATSITTYGVHSKFLSLEQAQSSASATTYAAAKLALTKDPRANKTVKAYDGKGPRLWVDYDLGDTVSVDRFGTVTNDAIKGIQADFDGINFSHVIIEFNSIMYDNDMRMAAQLDDLTNQWATARDANLLETSQWLNVGAPNGVINASLIYNDELYVFGDFTAIANIAATRAAKYNLSTGVWSALAGGVSAEVLFATLVGTTIYVATDATVRKWASGVWTTIGTLTSGSVRCMATDGTDLVVGGSFLAAAGLSSDKVARWDGSSWLNTYAVGYDCQALTYFGGLGNPHFFANLYTGVNTSCLQYYSAGSWRVLFNTQAKICGGLGSDENWLYYVLDNNHVVRYDGAGLTYDEDLGDLGFTPAAGILSYTVPYASHLTDVYIGRVIDADFPNGIVKYSGGLFFTLDAGALASGDVRTISIADNGDVYAGGSFVGMNGQPSNYLTTYVTDFHSMVDHLANDANNNYDLGNGIHNATTAAITDTSEFSFWDSVTGLLRKITWANIKATLKTYFDTLYQPVDADLTVIAGLSPTDDDIIQRKAGAWTNRTIAQLLTDATEGIQDIVGAMMQVIGGMSVTYNDSTGKIEFIVDADSVNAMPSSGWFQLTGTMTYASASTINVSSGADNAMAKGWRIRWKQTGDSNYRYAPLTTVASTLLTIAVNTDHVVANSTITELWYSPLEKPMGFPGTFTYAPATPTGTGFTLSNGTLAGKYSISSGGRVRWTTGYTFGSSDTMGTASLSFANPVTIVSPEDTYRGTGLILDSGTTRYELFVEVGASSVVCYLPNSAGTYVVRGNFSATVPMTWATGDKISFQGEGWLA